MQCSGEVCTCYAYELLCLKRVKSEVSLEYTSYEEAEKCPITKCLCNFPESPQLWASTSNINDGVSLPEPVKVQLPSPEQLSNIARKGSSPYEK